MTNSKRGENYYQQQTKITMIEKLDLEKLGLLIIEWKDGSPDTESCESCRASRNVAIKLNEIIDYINEEENREHQRQIKMVQV